MDKSEQERVFDILYALAACNGREKALFGASAPYARIAFSQSMACEAFPEVWFEVPLKGEPWFDLHLLASRESLDPDMTFRAGDTGGYPGVFEWFAKHDNVRQLALSWDTGRGEIKNPAVQVLMRNANPDTSCSFLAAAGRSDLQDAYRAFVGRIPKEWYACYTGVFPARQADFVRVECIVESDELQHAYVQDAALLEAHLRQAGVRDLGETVVPRCQQLAQGPFTFEFQFDVMPDGTTGRTMGASVRFSGPPGSEQPGAFQPDGLAGRLMEQTVEWGLADERWRLLAEASFAKRASRADVSFLLSNFPAFLKLRWREGEPLDAKTYFLARLQEGAATEE